MRGVAAFAAVLVAAVGCGAGQSAPGNTAPTADTSLKITLWPQGRDGDSKPRQWTLRCEPDGGTLPRKATACDRLSRLARPFAPTSKDVVCTDLYGGPQQALVTGVHEGKRVWATLSARNGCEIARWNRVAFLLGNMRAGGGSAA
jgi:hypothetical protein